MKVLHANDNYHVQGGVGQYILSVGALLQRTGHESVVMFRQASCSGPPNAPWPAYQIDDKHDVQVQVAAAVAAERPDVAFIHHLSSVAMIEALMELLPAVAYVHGFQALCPGMAKIHRRGNTVCERPFGWGCFPLHYARRCSAARHPQTIIKLMARTGALQKALLAIDRLFVATSFMKELLVQNGFHAERISVLAPHFFAAGSYPKKVDPPDEEMILFAGRLEFEKGLPYLFEAFTQVRQSAKLVIAGNGSLRSRYEALAAEFDLCDRVSFVGWQTAEQLAELYQQCAIVVMPSIFPEPFGKVGVEALAHARPVVAFDVGGISDWLKHGKHGFLVEPRDIDSLANRIEQLLSDAALATKLGVQGRTFALQSYGSEAHMKKLVETFERVIAVS